MYLGVNRPIEPKKWVVLRSPGYRGGGLLAITERLRYPGASRLAALAIRLGLATTFLLLLVVTPASVATPRWVCKSVATPARSTATTPRR